MFTLYRAANSNNPRAAFLMGSKDDEKPIDQKNGAAFQEKETGRIYRFDEENKIWYEGVLSND